MFGTKWGFRKKRNKKGEVSSPDASANVSISSISTKSAASSVRGRSVVVAGADTRSTTASSIASHVDQSSDESESDDESAPVYLTMEETLNLGVLDHIDRQIAILDRTHSEESAEMMDSFLLFENGGPDDGPELEMIQCHETSATKIEEKRANVHIESEHDKENNNCSASPRPDDRILRDQSQTPDSGKTAASSLGKDSGKTGFESQISTSDVAEDRIQSQNSFNEEYSLVVDDDYDEKVARVRDELDAVLDEVLADSPAPTPTPPSNLTTPENAQTLPTPVVSETQHFWMNCLEENGVDLRASPVFDQGTILPLPLGATATPSCELEQPVLSRNNSQGSATDTHGAGITPRQLQSIATPRTLTTFDHDEELPKKLNGKNTKENVGTFTPAIDSKLSYSPSCASSTCGSPKRLGQSDQYFMLSPTMSTSGEEGEIPHEKIFLANGTSAGRIREEDDDENLQDPSYLLDVSEKEQGGLDLDERQEDITTTPEEEEGENQKSDKIKDSPKVEQQRLAMFPSSNNPSQPPEQQPQQQRSGDDGQEESSDANNEPPEEAGNGQKDHDEERDESSESSLDHEIEEDDSANYAEEEEEEKEANPRNGDDGIQHAEEEEPFVGIQDFGCIKSLDADDARIHAEIEKKTNKRDSKSPKMLRYSNNPSQPPEEQPQHQRSGEDGQEESSDANNEPPEKGGNGQKDDDEERDESSESSRDDEIEEDDSSKYAEEEKEEKEANPYKGDDGIQHGEDPIVGIQHFGLDADDASIHAEIRKKTNKRDSKSPKMLPSSISETSSESSRDYEIEEDDSSNDAEEEEDEKQANLRNDDDAIQHAQDSEPLDGIQHLGCIKSLDADDASIETSSESSRDYEIEEDDSSNDEEEEEEEKQANLRNGDDAIQHAEDSERLDGIQHLGWIKSLDADDASIHAEIAKKTNKGNSKSPNMLPPSISETKRPSSTFFSGNAEEGCNNDDGATIVKAPSTDSILESKQRDHNSDLVQWSVLATTTERENVRCVDSNGSQVSESPRKIVRSIVGAKEAPKFDVVKSFYENDIRSRVSISVMPKTPETESPRSIARSKSEPRDLFRTFPSKSHGGHNSQRHLTAEHLKCDGASEAQKVFYINGSKSPDPTSQESESPRIIADSICKAKEAVCLDVAKSSDAARGGSGAVSSDDTPSPKRIAQSIRNAQEALGFCASKSYDGTDNRKGTSKQDGVVEASSDVTAEKYGGEINPNKNRMPITIQRPDPDSPDVQPPLSPQPRLSPSSSTSKKTRNPAAHRDSPMCGTAQVPPDDTTTAVEHTEISFPSYEWNEEEKKDCERESLSVAKSDSPLLTVWDRADEKKTGDDLYRKSKNKDRGESGDNESVFEDVKRITKVPDLANDPYKWAYLAWNRKGLLDQRKWKTAISTLNCVERDMTELINEERVQEGEATGQISSPLIEPANTVGAYDFRTVKESPTVTSQTQSKALPSSKKTRDHQSFPAAPSAEPRQRLRRHKSFANIMQMWRDKSEDQPLPHFLSPELTVRSPSPGKTGKYRHDSTVSPNETTQTPNSVGGALVPLDTSKTSTSIQQHEGEREEPSLSVDRVSRARNMVQTPEGERRIAMEQSSEKHEPWRMDVKKLDEGLNVGTPGRIDSESRTSAISKALSPGNQLNEGLNVGSPGRIDSESRTSAISMALSPGNQLNEGLNVGSPGRIDSESRTSAISMALSPGKHSVGRKPGKLKMEIMPFHSRTSPVDPRPNEAAPAQFDERQVSSIFRKKEKSTDQALSVDTKQHATSRDIVVRQTTPDSMAMDQSQIEDNLSGSRRLQASVPLETPEPEREKSPSFSVDLMWQQSSHTDDNTHSQSGTRDAGFLVLPKPSFAQASTFHFRHKSSERRRETIASSRRSLGRGRTVDEQLQRPTGRQSIESRRKRNSSALNENRNRRVSEPVRFNVSPSRCRADPKSVVKSFLNSTEESQALTEASMQDAGTEKSDDTHSPSLYFKQAPSYDKKLGFTHTPSAVSLLTSRQDIPSEIAVKEDTLVTARWLKNHQGDSESRATTVTITPRTGVSHNRQLDSSFDAADSVFSEEEEGEPCECVVSLFSGNDELANFFLPKMGMACTCGKRRGGLVDPDEPTALKNILRPWQVRFLAGFGITRGDQLVKANHRSAQALATSLRQYRRKHHMTAYRTKSCGMAIQIWARTAKTFVRSIRHQLVDGTAKLEPPNTMEILSSFLDKMQQMDKNPKPARKNLTEGPKEEI